MVNDKASKRTNSLSKLRQLLTQEEPGLIGYLYPKLTIGDIWWIPDSVTGFSPNREQHPWVIVNGYSPHVIGITVCPRTSTFGKKDLNRGIFTPANLVTGLEREGVFLLWHRRSIATAQFRNFEYIGKLPSSTLNEIRNYYQSKANGKIK